MIKSLSFVRQYLSFTLTLICVLGTFVLAWFKGIDITGILPVLLGLYLGARTGEKMSAHWAASKDGTADTKAVIETLNDK